MMSMMSTALRARTSPTLDSLPPDVVDSVARFLEPDDM